MARDQYITIPLDDGLVNFPLVQRGTSVAHFICLELTPLGTPVTVQIGNSNANVPWVYGQYWNAPDKCSPENDGIFVSSPAVPGGVVAFYVDYGANNGVGLSGV